MCPGETLCRKIIMWLSDMVEPVGKISIAPVFPVPSLVLQLGALTSLSHNTLSQSCLRTVPCYGPKGMPSMGLRTRGAFSQKAFPSAAAQGLLYSVSGQFVPVLPTLFVFLSPTQWLSPRILTNGFIQPLTSAWPIEPSPDPALLPQCPAFRGSCLSWHLFGPGLLTAVLLPHPGFSVLFLSLRSQVLTHCT